MSMQTPPMQVDASPDYLPSWIDMSQIEVTQESLPQPSQPSSEIPQRVRRTLWKVSIAMTYVNVRLSQRTKIPA